MGEVDSLTLKRTEAGALEYLANQRAAKVWIEEVIQETIPRDDLSLELQDGVILCKLISIVYPPSAQNIRVVTASPYEYMKINNINMFLTACVTFGLKLNELFDAQELYHKRDMPRVLRTIRKLAEFSASKGFRPFWPSQGDTQWTSSQIQEVLLLPGVKKAIVNANFASRQAANFKAPQALEKVRKEARMNSDNPSHPRPSTANNSPLSSPVNVANPFASSNGWSSTSAIPTPPPLPPPSQNQAKSNGYDVHNGSDLASEAIAKMSTGGGLKSLKKFEEKEIQTDPVVEVVNFESLFAKLEEALKNKKTEGGEEYVTTPLHIAARCGQEGVLNLLLSQGEDVNALDENYNSPLHLAVSAGHEKIVHILIAAGGSTDIANADGEIPVRMAAARGDKAGMSMLKIINSLSRKNAETSHVSSNGNLSSAEWDQERQRLDEALNDAERSLAAEKQVKESLEKKLKKIQAQFDKEKEDWQKEKQERDEREKELASSKAPDQDSAALEELMARTEALADHIDTLREKNESLSEQLEVERKTVRDLKKKSNSSNSINVVLPEDDPGLPNTIKSLDKYIDKLYLWRKTAERLDIEHPSLTVSQLAEMDILEALDLLNQLDSRLKREIGLVQKILPSSSTRASSPPEERPRRTRSDKHESSRDRERDRERDRDRDRERERDRDRSDRDRLERSDTRERSFSVSKEKSEKERRRSSLRVEPGTVEPSKSSSNREIRGYMDRSERRRERAGSMDLSY